MGISEKQFNIESMPMEMAHKYFKEESEWIDDQFSKYWPKIYSNFARAMNRKLAKGKQPNAIERVLVWFFARASKLTIRRNKHLNMMSGKGFRPGHSKTVLEAITVTVLRGKKEVASRRFELSAIIK